MLIAPAAETQCWLVDIVDATDVPLCGGKAAGLARLEQAGWAVPAAICVTTDFYRRWLAASGLVASTGEHCGHPRGAAPGGDRAGAARARPPPRRAPPGADAGRAPALRARGVLGRRVLGRPADERADDGGDRSRLGIGRRARRRQDDTRRVPRLDERCGSARRSPAHGTPDEDDRLARRTGDRRAARRDATRAPGAR